MKIICATNMPFALEAFRNLGDVEVLAPREITAARVRDAEVLAVRSTTRINRGLLEGSRVRFVGTATIGSDHMDLDYLEKAGIAWCAAPGCNAQSVAEYLVAALLCLGERHGFTLAGKTLGVIGVGNVGRRVVQAAEALGLRPLLNDPPRRDAEGGDQFLPLERLLMESDIITLHVPLTDAGRYPTAHLAGQRFFEELKSGCIFINAARGRVVDLAALLAALDRRAVAHAVLDTWEGEPAIRPDLLPRVDLGTPHIAGYSYDGRVAGTMMVFRECCRFLGVKSAWTPDALLPPPPTPEVRLDAAGQADEAALREIVRRVYDIEADDRNLRVACAEGDAAQRADKFEQLRRNYPVRREFRFTRVLIANGGPRLAAKARGLGFKVEQT